MKKILHISYDLRDKYDRKVTPAIRRLIDLSDKDFDNFTIDLVRVSKPKDEDITLVSPNHLKINAFGLPYGLFMNWTQNRVYNNLVERNLAQKIRLMQTDVVHSHKLTFEGLVGHQISQYLNVPHIVTLRQTDIFVLTKKPGAIKKFKPVIERCSKIIYLIPQILIRMEKVFGKLFFDEHIAPKAIPIPNIVDKKKNNLQSYIKKGNFLTVLAMTKACVLRKNIKRLLIAFSHIQDTSVKLTLVGSGEYLYKVKKWVKNLRLNDRVQFVGKINNNEIDKYYSEAEAFLLPSLSESFGLVYAESLLSGTPIMYSKDHLGFDGFFEGVGVGVNPLSIDSIEKGIMALHTNNESYRETINNLYKRDKFKIFSSEYVAEQYCNTINSLF